MKFYVVAIKPTASNGDHGLLNAMFYLTFCIGSLLSGPLSNTIGRRPTILLCCIGMAAGFALQALADSFPTLVVFRSFSGLFGAVPGVCQSYINDCVEVDELPKYTSYLGLFLGLTWTIGPLISLGLQEVLKLSFPNSPKWWYRVGFYFAAFANFIMFFIAYWKLEESFILETNDGNDFSVTSSLSTTAPGCDDCANEEPLSHAHSLDHFRICQQQSSPENSIHPLPKFTFDESPTKPRFSQPSSVDISLSVDPFENEMTHFFRSGEKNPYYIHLLMLNITYVLIELTFVAHSVMYPLFLGETVMKENPWTSFEFGFVFALWGASYSAIQLLYPKIEQNVGSFYAAAGAGILMMISILGIAIVAPFTFNSSRKIQVISLFPFSIINGVGYGICITAACQIVCQLCSAKDAASWLGVQCCCACFGDILAFPFGLLADYIGLQEVFFITSCCTFIGILMLFNSGHSVKQMKCNKTSLSPITQSIVSASGSLAYVLSPVLSHISSAPVTPFFIPLVPGGLLAQRQHQDNFQLPGKLQLAEFPPLFNETKHNEL